jgi:lysozyme
MLKGIDVSNWQREVDWESHADRGVTFAFAKATEGESYRDTWFERNWTRMREHWIVRGAYHFARPAGDPEEQARHFTNVVTRASSGPGGPGHGLRRGDLLALDLEADDECRPGTVAEFARVWCEAVTEWTGVRPFIYTYFSFADKGNCEGLDRYPLWIAAPGRPKGDPDVPGPWRDWTIHQYSHTPLDKNVFDGTRAELIRHGKRPPHHRHKHAHRHKHHHHDKHHHERRQGHRGHHRDRRGD